MFQLVQNSYQFGRIESIQNIVLRVNDSYIGSIQNSLSIVDNLLSEKLNYEYNYLFRIV